MITLPTKDGGLAHIRFGDELKDEERCEMHESYDGKEDRCPCPASVVLHPVQGPIRGCPRHAAMLIKIYGVLGAHLHVERLSETWIKIERQSRAIRLDDEEGVG